ncbi:MAG: DinB family protein [Candidatus Promineifilaceae bacterium]
MHSADILKYGHLTVVSTVEGLPESDWNISGACGVWSVREIVAHLASFEHVLTEISQWILDEETPTPLLQQYIKEGLAFNDNQVALRQAQTVAETWDEYETTCMNNLEIVGQIPVEKFRQAGILPWYGKEYDLEDFLVYTFYGHKREHGAQINAFRDILKQQKVTDSYA